MDPTTAYANNNDLYIRIERVSKKGTAPKPVEFKAAITNYSESITASWNEETVFGKMDPIATYQNTQRVISISWTVIAMDLPEGRDNLAKAARLQKFLYPAYEGPNATDMVDSPLLRMSFLNFIKGGSNGALMGYTSQFTYSPVLEDGVFHELDPSGLVPKRIEMGCEFKVLHEEELGWKIEDGDYVWRGRDEFPFNAKPGKQKKSVASPSVDEREYLSFNPGMQNGAASKTTLIITPPPPTPTPTPVEEKGKFNLFKPKSWGKGDRNK